MRQVKVHQRELSRVIEDNRQLGPNVTMKWKGKAPTYKLQSDIEVAIDLKKGLEERILNGKVEFTFGEVLEIVKREFHEAIMDIIKQKRHSLGD